MSARAIALLACACACGGSAEPAAVSVPPPPAPLPTPPEPPPPPKPIARDGRPGDVTLAVSFAEIRKHPEAPRIDSAIRSAPAWRAFPTIDPVRDLDWMTRHGEDMVVHHDVADAQVDAAIAAIARPVKLAGRAQAWQGVVNYQDTLFVRAEPHVVLITPATEGDVLSPRAPSFHAGEAARLLLVRPARVVQGLPDDIRDMRVWVDSRPADAGADVYGEADCPDAAAAQADAAAIAALIQSKNNFGVRLITGGLLNHVEITAQGSQVHLHVSASQQQIESLVSLASSMYTH